jgi:hypothetical protein
MSRDRVERNLTQSNGAYSAEILQLGVRWVEDSPVVPAPPFTV